MSRRIDVFFYGLFMDADLLRARGFQPQGVEVACVYNYELRVGRRATLQSHAGARAWGVVMSLTSNEIQTLYADPSVGEYLPVIVVAHLASGGTLSALCYNLTEGAERGPRDVDYSAKLLAVGHKVGLPNDYLLRYLTPIPL